MGAANKPTKLKARIAEPDITANRAVALAQFIAFGAPCSFGSDRVINLLSSGLKSETWLIFLLPGIGTLRDLYRFVAILGDPSILDLMIYLF